MLQRRCRCVWVACVCHRCVELCGVGSCEGCCSGVAGVCGLNVCAIDVCEMYVCE